MKHVTEFNLELRSKGDERRTLLDAEENDEEANRKNVNQAKKQENPINEAEWSQGKRET